MVSLDKVALVRLRHKPGTSNRARCPRLCSLAFVDSKQQRNATSNKANAKSRPLRVLMSKRFNLIQIPLHETPTPWVQNHTTSKLDTAEVQRNASGSQTIQRQSSTQQRGQRNPRISENASVSLVDHPVDVPLLRRDVWNAEGCKDVHLSPKNE